MAIDDLVDIVGRSTIETVLRLSAEQVAGAPQQEYILFQPTEGLAFITELELRQIAREPLWDRPREIFERLLKM